MDPRPGGPQGAAFLAEMARDPYFPTPLVEKGRRVLIELCAAIERRRPADLDALYALTDEATEAFNALALEFEAAGSGIETAARECIAADFRAIADAYGFGHADVETMIGARDW